MTARFRPGSCSWRLPYYNAMFCSKINRPCDSNATPPVYCPKKYGLNAATLIYAILAMLQTAGDDGCTIEQLADTARTDIMTARKVLNRGKYRFWYFDRKNAVWKANQS